MEIVMVNLKLQMICVDPVTRTEQCLATVESDHFDPEGVNLQIVDAIDAARVAIGASKLDALQPWQPEVTIALYAEGQPFRASLNLDRRTIAFLASAGASLDFDPYV
jgi:hypothetical protein